MPAYHRLLEVALYAVLNFLPFMLIALYPFRDKLRFSKPVSLYIFVSALLMQVSIGLLSAFTQIPDSILSAGTTLIYAMLFFIMIRAHAGQIAFTLLMISNIANAVVMCAKCLEGIFFPELAVQDYRWSLSLIMALVEAVLLIPLFFYVRLTYTAVFQKQTGKATWWYLWLIPGTFYIVWFYHIYGSTQTPLEQAMDPQNAIFLLIITSGSMLIYNMVVRMINATSENLQLTEQNYQMAMEKLQFEGLQERINEARQARHDIRHHITAMDSYLASGEYEKLREYLTQYRRSLPDETVIHFCNHSVANSILHFFGHRAKEHSIDYDILADIPVDLPIANNLLSVILGNLLENALEACTFVDDRPRSIVLRSRCAHNAFFLELDNTYSGELKRNEKGYFLSTKHKGRGIGISSVRNIVEKMDGLLEIEPKEGMFCVSVYIPLPTDKK